MPAVASRPASRRTPLSGPSLGSLSTRSGGLRRGLPRGIVLTDAGYGNDTDFRSELTVLGLIYAVGIQVDDRLGARHPPASGKTLEWQGTAADAAAPG